MDRVRNLFLEALIIVLAGVTIAFVITGVIYLVQRPTLADFKKDYTGKTLRGQVTVASEYLKVFMPTELNQAIEEMNAEGFCHSQAHGLGRAVYQKYPNLTEAIHQCGTACTYGCFHGVLMEMFATDSDTLGGAIEEESPEAYLSSVERSAKDLCSREDVASAVHARYCYHGIGHVFGFIGGTDLDKGLASCSIYTNDHAWRYCRSGVFMEYLFSSSSKPILNTTGPEPCDKYPDESKCFRYKAYGWLYVWGGIAPALAGCSTFGSAEHLCISNVAEAAATPLLLSTREGIEHICGTLSGEKKATCIDGALNKIIDLNNGDDSEHVCDVVAPEFRQRCLDVRTRYEADVYFSY